MDDLTGFQRDLLYVIAGHDGMHGLGVKDVLEADFDTTVDHGQLYPNLDAVVEMDLVEKGIQDRRTNTYTLTDRGRRELAARRQWEDQCLEDVPSISIGAKRE
jgi:PadR family transcriptional regulator PadR